MLKHRLLPKENRQRLFKASIATAAHIGQSDFEVLLDALVATLADGEKAGLGKSILDSTTPISVY
jgi:hypothetical protein